MPSKLIWTAPRDSGLRRLRQAGIGWDRVAAVLGVSRNAAMERARRIGARMAAVSRGDAADADDMLGHDILADPTRPPLPAGHARSWGVLVAGTTLEGSDYEWPVRAPGRTAPTLERIP